MWSLPFAAFCCFIAVVKCEKAEYELVKWRLENYPPSTGGRPVSDLSQTINVSLTFQLLHMNEVNDVEQTFSVLAMLRIEWVDPFLSWKDKNEFTHIDQITVKPTAVWTPRILHSNNVEDQQVVMRFGERAQVTVKKDGSATWEPTGIFNANCKLVLKNFPFDKQNCSITFDSWLRYPLVAFERAEYGEQREDFFGSGSVWSPISYENYLLSCETYCQGNYIINMRRNVQYFLYNIIIPCILLSILQLASFCLNPEAPDRPAYSVSVLVAFGIFQIMIQDQIPKTSELIFLLLYIIIQFAIGTVSTIISTIFCYIVATRVSLAGDDKDAELVKQSTLNILRRVDLVCFIALFAATGASHAVIFAIIASN